MSYADRDKSRKLTGRWVGEVDTRRTDGTELRYRKRFATKGEADGYEAYVKATGNEPAGATRAPTRSFRAAAERFKAENRDWVNAHGSTNAQRLDYAITYLGELDIGMIRKTQLIDFIDGLMKRTGRLKRLPSNRTVNNYLNAVAKVLRDCFEREEIPSMPPIPRKPDRGNSRDVVPHKVEDDACAYLVRKGKTTHAFLVRVLAMSGMRRGELYELRPEQIETPEQVENTGWMLTKEQTKTNQPRWVPMQPEDAKKLRVLLASRGLPKATQLAYEWKQAVIACGGNPATNIHCLRHTTNTRLLECHDKQIDVAILLGHSSGGMQRNYYHPSREYLFKVAKKVHRLAGENAKTGEVVALETLAKRAL